MTHHGFLHPLEKALRFYAVFALALILFQGLGMAMYLVNVWPTKRAMVSAEVTAFITVAVVMGFARSFLWILIYWKGAGALALIRTEDQPSGLASRLCPILASLTRLLVGCCVLDFLFVPAYFLYDIFMPFPLEGSLIGAVEVARLLFPQAFGLAALILAFFTHQYGRLLEERSQLHQELELTI